MATLKVWDESLSELTFYELKSILKALDTLFEWGLFLDEYAELKNLRLMVMQTKTSLQERHNIIDNL